MSQISLQENDTKLDTIETNANNYSHPTGNGNNHIPSNGSSGQFLGYSSAGTAAWVASPSASTTAGDVGTYAALHLSTNVGTSFGTTRSGSILRHANFYRDGNNNTTVSGTWRCMGQTGTYSGNNAGGSDTMGTIWVRIS